MSLSRFFQSGVMPFVVRWTPSALGREIFQLLGRVYYHVADRREHRLIRRNIRDLLRSAWKKSNDSVTDEVFSGIFDHYYEKLLLASKPIDYLDRFLKRRVALVHEDVISRAQERGRGVLLVTAHWGAEELIPAILYLRGYPVTVILETATERLRKTLEGQTAGRDVELLFASDPQGILSRIFDALARGRILVTQCDEVDSWRRRKSRTIELFGHTLFFDHTLDFIASKSGASVAAVFCRRFPGLRYRLICEEIATDGALARNVAVRSLSLWERYTLEAPEQWHQWKKWEAMKAI
jgi:Kdo2-lipid IVA lauroyltransferase/acyltransferase